MRCEDAMNQLNARADGELSEVDATELDAHLSECATCRATADVLPSLDTDLRRTFAARREAADRLATSVSEIVRTASSLPTSETSANVRPPRLLSGQTVVAAAAGFLLAVLVFRPWQSKFDVIAELPTIEPIARLELASGPVEVRPASQTHFLACEPSAPLEKSSVVRTGPTTQCEFSLKDGGALRLDRDTEVALHEPRRVELKAGRLWLRAESLRKNIRIQAIDGNVVVQADAEVNVAATPEATHVTAICGVVQIETGAGSVEVRPGDSVGLVKQQVVVPEQQPDARLDTAWINSLLALGDSNNPELVTRVRELLAQVGAAKLSQLYEDEIRRLGDAGVPPLLAYLDTTRETPTAARREVAARIVADVAHARRICDLIELLTDPNPDVRLHAARGLERLTGRNQGHPAESWQSAASWATCETPYQNWLNWWAANHHHYPSARQQIEKPEAAPF